MPNTTMETPTSQNYPKGEGEFGPGMEGLHQTNIAPRADYQILNSPEMRVEYLSLTDKLVDKIVKDKVEIVIYLDKSARPVQWLVHSLWDQLVPQDESGSPLYDEPGTKFINIDREQWGAIVGRSEGEGGIDISAIPEPRIDELRKVFSPPGVDILEDEKKPHKSPTMFTGKKIMVVDEIRSSGDTLDISQKVLNRAFPDAESIIGAYWMSGKVRRDPKTGVRKNKELPVWYDDKVVSGRLVDDRDTTKSLKSSNMRQRIGRFWLSTAFRERDRKGVQLKREIKQMAHDLRDHNLFYAHSGGWSKRTESLDYRIARLNKISPEEYKQIKAIPEIQHGNIKKPDYGGMQRMYLKLHKLGQAALYHN